MLRLTNVDTYYGPSQVLKHVSLEVNQGEIVCLLGANAAGKTTTMKTIFGLVHPRHGTIEFEGQPIQQRLPGDIVRLGMALVPEARRIFPRRYADSPRDSRASPAGRDRAAAPKAGRTRPVHTPTNLQPRVAL